MNKKLFSLLLCFIILLGLLAGCYEPKYKYAGDQDLVIYDALAETTELSESGRFFYTTENAEYCFSKKISPKERDRFVDAQEKIFSYLIDNNYVGQSAFFEIYILKNRGGFSRSEDCMFVANISATKTSKQILLTLQAVYGDFTNYGLLFGLGNIMAKDLKYKTDIPDTSSGSLKTFWATQKNQALSDLSYPCFIKPYVTAKELPAVKKTAYLLAGFIHKKDSGVSLNNLLMTDYTAFEALFTAYKNEWLVSLGGAATFTAKEIPLAFAHGGITYPLVFKTGHAVYYMENIYEELYAVFYGKDFFKSDYTTLISTLETLENEMTEIDGALKHPSYNYAQYIVILTHHDGLYGFAGLHWFRNSRTFSCTAYALLHEYIHRLTAYAEFDEWQSETIASYYGYYSYFKKLILVTRYKTIDDLSVIDIYLGREAGLDDIFVYQDIIAYLYESYDISVKYSTASISFSSYLVREYGETVYISLFTDRTPPQKITGKTWEQMKLDWIDWLQNEFNGNIAKNT